MWSQPTSRRPVIRAFLLPLLLVTLLTAVIGTVQAQGIAVLSQGQQPVLRETAYQTQIFKVRDRWYNPQIECYDLESAAACPGYPAAFAPGGTAYQTPLGLQPVLAENRFLYFAVARPQAGDWGLACWDVQTQDGCTPSFIPLGSEASSSLAAPARFAPGDGYLVGPIYEATSGRLYAYDLSQRVYCVQAGTGQPCNGFDALFGDFSALLPAFTALDDANPLALGFDAAGQRLLLFSNYARGSNSAFAAGLQALCLFVFDGSPCGGAGSLAVSDSGSAFPSGDLLPPITLRESAGEPFAHCVVAAAGGFCLDRFGGGQPLSLLAAELAALGSRLAEAYDPVARRSFIAASDRDLLLCFDWASNDLCADFGTAGTIAVAARPTGVALGEGDACGYVLGDGRLLERFSRSDGSIPCEPRAYLDQAAGLVYDSVRRIPLAGVRVTVVNRSIGDRVIDSACFSDAVSNPQLTAADGSYRLPLQFVHESCLAGDSYALVIDGEDQGYFPVAADGSGAASRGIVTPPLAEVATADCDGDGTRDQVPSQFGCQINPQAGLPTGLESTRYTLRFTGSSRERDALANNPIPLDPAPTGLDALSLFKRAILSDVSVGEAARWELRVENRGDLPMTDIDLIDDLPAGFLYRVGSARLLLDSGGGNPGDPTGAEPTIAGRRLSWRLSLAVGAVATVTFESSIAAGTPLGLYQNQAQVMTSFGEALSPQVSAAVRVVAEPALDCADLLGTLFEDRDGDGNQGPGELGVGGVTLYSVTGTAVTSDGSGRFSFPCPMVPDAERGSNFSVKVDPRSLPKGWRLAGRNPVLVRLTRGKLVTLALPLVAGQQLRILITDAAFEGSRDEQQARWREELALVQQQLGENVLSLTLVYDSQQPATVVRARLAALQRYLEQLTARQGWTGKLELQAVRRP